MIVRFIEAIYDENIPFFKQSFKFRKLLEDKEFMLIAPTVYSLLKQQNRLSHTPRFFQESLKKCYTDTLFKNLFIKSQTEQLLLEFENNKIHVMPLKGPLFAERFFGDMGARSSSDIDLLIHFEHLEQAIHCIRQKGFVCEKEEVPSGFNIGFYKEIPGSPIPLAVELHWGLVNERTANMDMRKLWEEAVLYKEFQYVKQLSNVHSFYMICLHGWRHNMESLKYYLDIIQILHTNYDGLSYNNLFQDAAADQTRKRILWTLAKVYRHFPFLQGIKLFPVDVQKCSLFPKNDVKSIQSYREFITYQFFTYDKVMHSLIEFKNWLLPSSALLNDGGYYSLFKKRMTSITKLLIHFLK